MFHRWCASLHCCLCVWLRPPLSARSRTLQRPPTHLGCSAGCSVAASVAASAEASVEASVAPTHTGRTRTGLIRTVRTRTRTGRTRTEDILTPLTEDILTEGTRVDSEDIQADLADLAVVADLAAAADFFSMTTAKLPLPARKTRRTLK